MASATCAEAGDGLGQGGADLVHALAGGVDLGTQLVGGGVDLRTDVGEAVGDGTGAVLVGVDRGIPRVVGGVGRHGAALGTGAGSEHHARDCTDRGADDATKDETETGVVLAHGSSFPS